MAVALAQSDNLDQIPAEARRNEVIGEETDVVQVGQIAQTGLVIERPQQDKPAIGADDDIELK